MDAGRKVSRHQSEVRRLLDKGQPHGAAIIYIAAVCYPFDQKGTDKFLMAQRAFGAKRLRDAKEEYIDDEARLLNPMSMRRTLNKTDKILMERLHVAVDVAMPVVVEQMSPIIGGLRLSGSPSRYDAIKRIIDQKSHYKKKNTRKSEQENYRRRKSVPASPVLHLAYAMAMCCDWDTNKTIQDLIHSPEWVEPALKHAQQGLPILIRANLINASKAVVNFDS